MVSAALELLCCSQVMQKGNRELRLCVDRNLHETRANGPPRTQLLFHGKTVHKGKRLRSAWKDCIHILGKSNCSGWSLGNQHEYFIKAVATVEPKCLVSCENDHLRDSDMQFRLNSDSQVFQSSSDDSHVMDEDERLRRMKISKANKGNVPWNKGRKHSAETIQRIRERTRIAMQDPKVKMKLMNLGHAQSEETRIKIAVGVREGWQRRREMLMVQESCLFEWQNMIVEASRKGYAGEQELQLDSYKMLDEQLKQEWLESIEKRKTMPRPKGSKRAPKSLEQRRKISEAISAKWADPEYRNRVYAALSKYHGTLVGAEKPRRKPTRETSSVNRTATKTKSTQLKGINNKATSVNKATPRKKRNAVPLYKDPMALSKLEMIKKIRAERTALETKKREATERAMLLIAEAEKAARALEVAAPMSPLAQASLLETRKLIAEATRSIESILRSQDPGDNASFDSGRPTNYLRASRVTSSSETLLGGRPVNGSHLLSSSDINYNGSGLLCGHLSPSSKPNNLRDRSSSADWLVGQPKINGSIRCNGLLPQKEDGGSVQAERGESSTTSGTRTKKWVCGKLVEADE